MNRGLQHGHRFDRVSPWWLAITLSFLLLAIPAYQLASTLILVGNRTEVTRAVWDGLAAAPVRWALLLFVLGHIALHALYAAAVVFLARLSARLWPGAAGINGFVVLWFALGTLAALGLNALWFPRSESGEYYHDLASTSIAGHPAALILAIVVGAAVMAVMLIAAARGLRDLRPPHRPALLLAAGAASIALVGYGVVSGGARASSDSASSKGKPHVIILGVDSLRLDELRRNGGNGKTPNLDAFLESADMFSDVTTPVARTFPSWVAILTGRPPRETGAVFNLVPRPLINASPTLADVLRDSGYRTVLATDEVRFSNIDQSYGFDQLITPPIGAADFLMGKITDLPLTNVVINTRLGRQLFPYSHANRAAAMIFKPRSFVDLLEAELELDQPTFLVTHLCAAHWPYFVAGVAEDADHRKHADDRPLYDIGLGTADAMFGEIVTLLERKGALRNAIVVVLSDHGEALSISGDSLLGDVQTDRVAGLKVPVNLMDWGHGQSVLSPVQYSVLLGFRTFGDGIAYRPSGRTIDDPATVLDIKPTLLDLLEAEPAAQFSYAMSLGPLLRGSDPATSERLHARARFTETDLRVSVNQLGDIDEDAAARENSIYFTVNRTTGRLELRPSAFPALMAFKERAAILGPWMLAAVPADVDHHQYLLIDRHTGAGRVLDAAPDATDGVAHPLWTQLHSAFGDELRPPVVLESTQIPQVNARWMQFLSDAVADARTDRTGT